MVAVNKTGNPKLDLPFTLVDATQIATAFTDLGYRPLDPDKPILTGQEATRSSIIKYIKSSQQGKYENDLVLIYFTGHGAVGTKDLYLQTYGQEEYGEGQGIALSEIVTLTRYKKGDPAFEGELIIIVDTCFSGQATVSQSLTLGEVGFKTVIFSSSTKIQESYSLSFANLPHMSAFTYSLLQALGPDWEAADHDGDGILRYPEIHIFTKNLLVDLHQTGRVEKLMEPKVSPSDPGIFLAYKRDKVRTLNAPYRKALQNHQINKVLAEPLQMMGMLPKEKPELSPDVRALAKGLEPAVDDFYSMALKATIEERPENARIFFDQAEKQLFAKEKEEEFKRQDALKYQQEAEVHQQTQRKKRHDLYLARARMETYDGKFAEAFSWYQQAAHIKNPIASELLDEIGVAGLRAENYSEAEPYLLQSLEKRRKDLNTSNPDLALGLNNLATLRDTQGKIPEAESLYKEALRLNELTLGPDHPQVLLNLNNLAVFYQTYKYPHEAKLYFNRVLKIIEENKKIDPSQISIYLNNIGFFNQAQGNFDEALKFYNLALHTIEKVFGQNNPHFIVTLRNKASLYKLNGNYDEAENLYNQALRIDKNILGPHDLEVAQDLNMLGELYRDKQCFIRSNSTFTEECFFKAQSVYKEMISIYEEAYGKDSSQVAESLTDLAFVYHVEGSYEEAKTLYNQALAINEKSFSNYLQNIRTLNNLGILYKDNKKWDEAETILKKVLQLHINQNGWEHYTTAHTLQFLGVLYKDQKRFEEAEPYYQKSFSIFFRARSSEDPSQDPIVKSAFYNYQDFLEISGQKHDEDRAWEKLRQFMDLFEPYFVIPGVGSPTKGR